MLDAERIRAGLRNTIFVSGGVECLDEVGSTNDIIVDRGREGAGEGLVIFAESQSRGRGRRGDAWVSRRGENLLFSFLVRPVAPQLRWSRLTHLTALAICLGVEAAMPEVKARVKWPNDVYVEGKKVAGVLIENHGEFVVIGAGLNVNGRTADFPAEFRGQSTTLLEHNAGREKLVREDLAVAVLEQFAALYPKGVEDFAEVRDGVWSRSALEGKEVRAMVGEESVLGKVRGLGPEGELVLLQADGQERFLSAADRVREI